MSSCGGYTSKEPDYTDPTQFLRKIIEPQFLEHFEVHIDSKHRKEMGGIGIAQVNITQRIKERASEEFNQPLQKETAEEILTILSAKLITSLSKSPGKILSKEQAEAVLEFVEKNTSKKVKPALDEVLQRTRVIFEGVFPPPKSGRIAPLMTPASPTASAPPTPSSASPTVSAPQSPFSPSSLRHQPEVEMFRISEIYLTQPTRQRSNARID